MIWLANAIIINQTKVITMAGDAIENGVIVIEGGVETIPAALIDQLKDGGRIAAIFMDGALGECRIGHKLDGKMNWRMAFNATAPVLPGFTKASGFVL